MIEDFDYKVEAHFYEQIAKGYFETLFIDVAQRSVTPRTEAHPEQFVDNVAFFEYTKLPGIICDRFFNIFKRVKPSNFVVKDEFVKGFMTVFLSSLEQKMRMTFSM